MMRDGIKQSLVIAVVAVATGCASGGTPIPDPQSAAAQRYAEKCSGCHAVPHPARHSAAAWPHYVALMEQRIAERNHTPLSDEERLMIISYLRKHAR